VSKEAVLNLNPKVKNLENIFWVLYNLNEEIYELDEAIETMNKNELKRAFRSFLEMVKRAVKEIQDNIDVDWDLAHEYFYGDELDYY